MHALLPQFAIEAGIEVEPTYEGAHLEFPLVEENVLAMLEEFKQGRQLHVKYAFQLLRYAKDIFSSENTLQTSVIAQGSKVSLALFPVS